MINKRVSTSNRLKTGVVKRYSLNFWPAVEKCKKKVVTHNINKLNHFITIVSIIL